MNKNAEIFITNTLGSDFIESFGSALSKSEVYKPGTRTVTDTNDLFQGLLIVPKTLLNLLVKEMSPMQIGETKEIKIPIKDTIVTATKHERDSFSGQVIQDNVKISDFMHRSIPGLGLVLMTVLELYNVEDLEKRPDMDQGIEQKINKIIDERMNLHSLVNKVVDGKLMHRDAVQQLILSKLTEMTQEHKEIKEVQKEAVEEKKSEKAPTIVMTLVSKKKLPLADFVENRNKKIAKKEFSIQMVKGEIVDCPDCGNQIFNDSGISACICYGSDMGRKVFLKKTENGVKLSFPNSWSNDNIEMLLEVLRGQNE